MSEEAKTQRTQLKMVRLAFPQLFTPKPPKNNPNADPRYSAVFIMDPEGENARKVQQEIERKAQEKWGEDAKKVLSQVEGDSNKMCFLNGGKMADYDGFENSVFLRSHEWTRPTVIDRDRSPLRKDDGKPYAGCYVNALIEFWMQENSHGRGIRSYLKGVQFVEDGPAFSGGQPASEDEFEDLSDGSDAPALGREDDDESLLG